MRPFHMLIAEYRPRGRSRAFSFLAVHLPWSQPIYDAITDSINMRSGRHWKMVTPYSHCWTFCLLIITLCSFTSIITKFSVHKLCHCTCILLSSLTLHVLYEVKPWASLYFFALSILNCQAKAWALAWSTLSKARETLRNMDTWGSQRRNIPLWF